MPRLRDIVENNTATEPVNTTSPPPPPTESPSPPPTQSPPLPDAVKLDMGAIEQPDSFAQPGQPAPTPDPTFHTTVTDADPVEELAKRLENNPVPPMTPDPTAPDTVQPAALSQKTIDELNAVSQKGFNESAQDSVRARTLAEQEAGREALARKGADIRLAQEVGAKQAAKRLADEAPAHPSDLSYNTPKL